MSRIKRMLNSDEISYFCYQLAMILDSGVPLYDGLLVLSAEMREKSSAEANDLMDEIVNYLAEEMPLYSAMEKTGVFPVYCIKSVMAGELSGRLYQALSELAEYYEKDSIMHENVRSAVSSPLIMLVISIIIITVLIVKILPMFSDIFSNSAPELYGVISKSVEIAAIAGAVMLVICIICAAASAVLYFMWQYGGEGKAAVLVSKLPVIGKASRAISLARFSGAVSMMLGSGLSPAEAMQNVRGISSDPNINKKIDDCADMVMNDVPFSDALEKTELLPVFYAQTLRVSYRSGSFDTAWKKITAKLTAEADTRLEHLIALAEPVLTAILTAASGVIMLTVMIPLMNIMSAL